LREHREPERRRDADTATDEHGRADEHHGVDAERGEHEPCCGARECGRAVTAGGAGGERSHATARSETEVDRHLDTLAFKEAGAVGIAQIGALFAGISLSGVTMVAGLVRGLDHEDAARFSFLLATPIILAAGVYKVPDLAGHLGAGVRGQALVGAIFAGLAAYVAVRFLMRFFEIRTIMPFAICCLVVGGGSIIRFAGRPADTRRAGRTDAYDRSDESRSAPNPSSPSSTSGSSR
jgi:hypothetical protein